MQNKPNSRLLRTDISHYLTYAYSDEQLSGLRQNKPNQTRSSLPDRHLAAQDSNTAGETQQGAEKVDI
ncbi:MAG: hypothetical protein ACYSSP_08135 [Planctomycetota bacterium]